MDAITYTYARNNLAETMQQACNNHDPIIVTRENEPAVVMMSLEDFQSIEETAYLLRSPKNAKRLLESITQLDNGKGMEKELIE